MDIDCISFRKTGYFSPLICDYLDQREELKPFYHRFPSLEAFDEQLREKAQNYTVHQRKVLVEALQNQYLPLEVHNATSENIQLLRDAGTFTITTGHQLNLFTGPMYFLYKIISTINLCEELKERYPNNNFIPIYWMATEDHDFEEINYFNFQGLKIQWNGNAGGAVGRMETKGLDKVLEVFESKLITSKNSQYLKGLFRKAYVEQPTLTHATRFLVNELFGEYGLVIIDGDDSKLKRLMIPHIEKDLFENLAFQRVNETIGELSSISGDYKIQVNPREINYFYLKDGLRERILEQNGTFLVNETDVRFSRSELEEELDIHPERFSPNVIARPLYQEVILPNLCYIGGGGELAYWLELKSYFEAHGVTFPILLLRNSALVITQKQQKKSKNLDVKIEDLFLKQNILINKKIRQISNVDIDFSPQKKLLEDQFASLYELAQSTDPSFLGAVKAQEVKQKKGLDHLEKRLLKAQKKKLKGHVIRLSDLQNELFPNYSLQERQLNFSELYLEHGDALISNVKASLDPLQHCFSILRY